MSVSVNESSVEKKLRNLTNTQESIQTLSLWAINHKAAHDKLTEIWFKVLKKSKVEHRLVLFYLCNDIVQTCKRKHAIMYKDAFKDVLKDAALLVRDPSIRPNIERIFNIWKERMVYDAEFMEELKAVLNNTKVRAVAESKLVTEFKPTECMEKIMELKRKEDEAEVKRKSLIHVKTDASSIEAVKQLKDRTQGKEFCGEFELACTKLEDYVGALSQEMAERTTLIEMLEQSELYYDAQYGEAKIVANAYKNFGSRVNNLRKRLVEHAKSLPTPPSPVPSPTMDAPSPGNTPPQIEGGGDCLQPMDMELDDDPPPPPPPADNNRDLADGARRGRWDNTSVTGALSKQPIASVTHITMTGHNTSQSKNEESYSPASDDFEAPAWKPGITRPDDDPDDDDSVGTPKASPIADSPGSLVKTLAESSSFTSSGWEQIPIEEDLPATDDGGATPTLDENTQEKQPTNPIDFLTQLINKKNVKPGIDSHFFKNLSLLSKTVKSQYEDDKPSTTTEPANTWSNDSSGNTWNSASSSAGYNNTPYTPGNTSYQQQAAAYPPPPPPPDFTATSQPSAYGQNFTGNFNPSAPPPPPQGPPPPVPPVGATAESPTVSFMSSQPNQPAPPANSWTNNGQTNAYGQVTPPSPLPYTVNPLAAAPPPYGQPNAHHSTSPPANPPLPLPNLPVQTPVNIPPGQSSFPPPYSPTNTSPVGNPPAPVYGASAPPPPQPQFGSDPDAHNRNLTNIPTENNQNGTQPPLPVDAPDSRPINTIQRQSSGGEDSFDENPDTYNPGGPGKARSNLRPLTCIGEEDNKPNPPPNRRLSMDDAPRLGGPGFNRYPPPQTSPRSPYPQRPPPPNRFSPYQRPQREPRPFFHDSSPYGAPRGMRPPPPHQRYPPPPPRPGFRHRSPF